MDCRKCGTCCVAPSIATPIPNMPRGKPAGARCANLSDRNECTLYGKAERPTFCLGWEPALDVCGQAFDEAMIRITAMEQATASAPHPHRHLGHANRPIMSCLTTISRRIGRPLG